MYVYVCVYIYIYTHTHQRSRLPGLGRRARRAAAVGPLRGRPERELNEFVARPCYISLWFSGAPYLGAPSL